MVRAAKRKAWVSQLKRHLVKFGPDGASWYVTWLDPDGRQRMKACGAGPKGKELAESMADELHSALVATEWQATVDKTRCLSVSTHNGKQFNRVLNGAWESEIDPDRVVFREGDFSKHYFERLKTRYGLDVDQVLAVLNLKQGKCDICGRCISESRICFDHCHEENVIRGLLCVSCNSGIGFLKESADIAEKAAAYLRTPPLRIFIVRAKKGKRRFHAHGI